MSHNVKMNFQTLPNVPFLQGWPGILGQEPWRKPPAVQGLLEFRPGAQGVKARSIQVEFVRIETMPGGGQHAITVIGAPVTVWQTPAGKEWDSVQATDFKFYIPLPLNIPGTVEMKPKGGGIRYELVANLSHKPKSGLLRRDSNPVTRTQQAIFITKHEQHSAWPIYNAPETRSTVMDEMELTVMRNYTAFGPADRIEVMACLRSSRPKPLKLRAFHLELIEVITFRPPVGRGAKQVSSNRTRVVHEAKVPVGEKIGRTEEKKRSVALVVPAGLVAHTTKGAKLFDIAYELSVKAIMEGMGDVKLEHLQVTLGIYGRPRAHDVVNQIGMVDALCPYPNGRPGVARSESQTTSIRSSFAGPSGHGPPPERTAFPEPRINPSNQLSSGHPGRPARNSYYGPMNPSIAQDMPNQARLSAQPFTPRPLSVDSSSIYSHPQWQSQSDVSSVRDLQPEQNFAARARPNTFGMSELPPHVMRDTKRMSWSSSQGMERGPSVHASPGTNLRPAGPARTPTSTTMVSEEGRRSMDARPRSLLLERPGISPTPSRRSYVHQDGGKVILNENGEVQQAPQIHPESSSVNQSRWNAAEAEKQRLYAEARRNAAMTQLSGGADLEPMGMANDVDVPHEPPPEYSPRQSGFPQVVVDPPVDSAPTSEISYPREKTGLAREANVDSGPGQDRAVEQPLATPLGEIPGTLSRVSPLPSANEIAVGTVVGLGINDGQSATVSADTNNQTEPSSSRQLPRPLTDKEQMKRYYEAQDRIAQAQIDSAAFGEDPSDAPPPAAGSSKSHMQPLSDKEAMRRFYEAQDQSARARAQSASFGENRDDVSPAAGPSGSSLQPLSDKEAMRRFYAAQDGMYGGQAGSSSYNADQGAGSSSGGISSSKDASSESKPRFMSATEEKDMMKRRYERATRQVSDHHQARHGESGWSESGHGHGQGGPSNVTPTRAEFGNVENGGSGSSQGHSRWASATEEKDVMRRRYEDAVNAMGQTNMAEGSSSASYADGQDQPERSYSSNSSSHAPPPIPARPNDEYKALLSPDMSPGMPGMQVGSPYMYGGPMMSPPFGMPMGPPFGPPMSPTMGSMGMFGIPPMGMGMMPPNNPFAYGMPGPMPQGYHAQVPYPGQYQAGPVDYDNNNGEGNDRQYRQDSS